jgi:hypothetical protein
MRFRAAADSGRRFRVALVSADAPFGDGRDDGRLPSIDLTLAICCSTCAFRSSNPSSAASRMLRLSVGMCLHHTRDTNIFTGVCKWSLTPVLVAVDVEHVTCVVHRQPSRLDMNTESLVVVLRQLAQHLGEILHGVRELLAQRHSIAPSVPFVRGRTGICVQARDLSMHSARLRRIEPRWLHLRSDGLVNFSSTRPAVKEMPFNRCYEVGVGGTTTILSI